MKERHIGQVSFNLVDEYERNLYEHAIKKEHGKFSQYIKRLIERDREGVKVNYHVLPQDSADDKEDVNAAGSFL